MDDKKFISNIPGLVCWYTGAAVNGVSVRSIRTPGAMENAKKIYQEKLLQLLVDRPLSMEEESNRAIELEDIWWLLSDEEQREIEAMFSEAPKAPESLNLVDRVAKSGVTPRVSTPI